MTDTTDWIDRFLRKFYRRLRPAEWPEPETDEYDDLRDDWIEALGRRDVAEADADAALRRLREDPPQWSRELLPKLLRAIDCVRAERRAEGAATDRDAAREASRGCEYCGGDGTLHVFHPRYDGGRVIWMESEGPGAEVIRKPFPAVVVAHCTCAAGRWMRRSIKDLEMLRRIPDLAAILEGRSWWLAQDPTRRDTESAPMAAKEAKGRLGERLNSGLRA